MKKIPIVIKREYFSRVRKKSFIIMTILGPILMAALMIVPIYIAKLSDDVKKIAIVDETGAFYDNIKNSETIKFEHLQTDIEAAKKLLDKSDYYGILHLPPIFINSPSSARFFSTKQPSLTVKSYIENILNKELVDLKLEQSSIDKEELNRIYKLSKLELATIKLSDDGEEATSSSGLTTGLSMFAGLLIYFFIFLFGAQVMRGVIEEKTSRIVEIIVSSLKPFQLMMGKIFGVALVGLTQFLLWVVLTFAIITFVQLSFPETFTGAGQMSEFTSVSNSAVPEDAMNQASMGEGKFAEIWESIQAINFPLMISLFVFYFLGGYLLYSALFAAIGSAVDNEADTQQFMLPVTAPLIFSIVMSSFVISNPQGPVSFWLSIIPFTSPIIMMMRIPFGVATWEVILSMGLLILGFLGTTWLAGKIYRTGILMYGKKINYKELGKWLFYKS